MFNRKDDQREHEKILANIQAKSVLVTELIKKANLSKTVILKSQVLKLDFIINIESTCEESKHSAMINYFDFDFDKVYCPQSTKTIYVKREDMSFQEVIDAIKSAN